MSTSSRFPTYHIPDDGTPYVPGEHVTVDHSSGRVRIVKDTDGTYEVMSCRPATEYGGDPSCSESASGSARSRRPRGSPRGRGSTSPGGEPHAERAAYPERIRRMLRHRPAPGRPAW